MLIESYWSTLEKPTFYGGKVRPKLYNLPNWQKTYSLLPVIPEERKFKITEENLEKVFVWSDTHFFHKNIIKFSNRPYFDIEQMNWAMIENFNEIVGKDDISIWVGDVGFAPDNKLNDLLRECNGYKILIIGNHDFNHDHLKKLNFDETYFMYEMELPDFNLVFTHYPLDDVPIDYINVHGHLHVGSTEKTDLRCINVCCEMIDYKPTPLAEIIRKGKMRLASL